MSIGEYRKRIKELQGLSKKIEGADYTERKKESLLQYLRLAIRETQDDMAKCSHGKIELSCAKACGDKKKNNQ